MIIVAGDLIRPVPPAPALSALHQLPSAVALVGRDAVLDELAGVLGTAGSAGATISAAGLQGMPGVGKTAVAVALAHRMKHRYPDAQLMFNLRGGDAAPARPDEIMAWVIQSFRPEARVPDDPAASGAAYRSVLAESGRSLLLLDNAAAADQVRPLLPPPNCLLLVTSRAQFQLPGLAGRALDCLAPEQSAELLLKLAPRLDLHAADAARLCGHLPLALEIFAGVVAERTLYAVPDLIDRLRRGLVALDRVDAAFALSSDLLTADQRRRWLQLAVFSARFDLAAAAAVWADEPDQDAIPDAARDAMQALVRGSLVEHHPEQERFRLHDLARRFGERRLAEPETTAARLRHAAHYCAVGEAADRLYLKGGDDIVRGLALFDRERAQLSAAFGWLRGRTDAPSARLTIRLVAAIAEVGDLRLHPREQIEWSAAQVAAARRIGDRAQEGSALGNLGSAYADLGETRQAIACYKQHLAIARKVGDKRGESGALGSLGIAYHHLGEMRRSIDYNQRSLAIDRKAGDRRGESRNLCSLGNSYLDCGEVSQGITCYEQALVISREIGDRRGEGAVLGNLGIVHRQLGRTPKAIEYFEQALAIDREIGDRRGEGVAFSNLGIAYAQLGEAGKAIDYLQQALVIDRATGNRRGEGKTLGSLGNTCVQLGELRKALEYYEQVLAIDREIGNRRGEGSSLWNSALVLHALGDRLKAVMRAEEALALFEALKDSGAVEVRAQLAEWRGEAA